jgi:hypothetical protein
VERRHDLPAELPLLLGEPEAPSYDALQRRIGELVRGEPVETRQIPKALAKAGVWLEDEVLDQEPFMIDQADDHYGLDVSRAERLLGWRPGHALLRELPRIIADLKADPARWYAANKLEPAVVAAAEAHQLREPQPTLGEQTATRRAYETWLGTARRQSNWAHLANIAFGACTPRRLRSKPGGVAGGAEVPDVYTGRSAPSATLSRGLRRRTARCAGGRGRGGRAGDLS